MEFAPKRNAGRIASLDQFRGYTVLAMFAVNFLSRFECMPANCKHHNTYCSFADTVMPAFFFAAGFAYRLTYQRRRAKEGVGPAVRRVVRRSLALILLGMVLYHLDGSTATWAEWQRLGVRGFISQAFQREVFQTLVHMGITALWILPVIGAGPGVRLLFGCFSAVLHLGLSHAFYYTWVMSRPGIDGGPLGFLTWSLPMLAGSWACDVCLAQVPWRSAGRLVCRGLAVMAVGYALACLNRITPPNTMLRPLQAAEFLVEPPFVPPKQPVNLWTMSQRAGSLSYQAFAAGFSLASYALFVVVCDGGRRSAGLFRTLGSNALAAYLLHGMVAQLIRPYAPKDAPLWFALSSFALFVAICYAFVRHLEKQQIFLRL